jgi:rRNA processing protein Krr1/Pno1
MGGLFSCCFGSSQSKYIDETATEWEIKCSQKWVSHVIGPGGSKIAELKFLTGAEIKVGRDGADPVSIHITGDPKQVKAAREAVTAVIKDAENPDYEGEDGKKFRKEADDHASRAEKLAKEKDALFDKGDKAGGRAKLEEVKAAQRAVHDANSKAARVIFENRNKGKGKLYMDFHGLRKTEAIGLLTTRLAELSGSKGALELVPGAGKHSGGGGAVLMPAVISLLKEKNLRFEEKTAGSLIVNL